MVRKRSGTYRWPGLDTRYPTHWRCTCGAEVLSGIHDSWPLLLDPQPLSQFGELEALLNGQQTFLLVDPHIYRRTAPAITRDPTGWQGNVHRKHKCNADIPQPASQRAAHTYDTVGGLPDECPF